MRSRAGTSLLLALALLPAACARQRTRHAAERFPIGIYGSADPGTLKPLQEAGFDSVQVYDTDPIVLKKVATEARRLGMELVLQPHQVVNTSAATVARWPVEAWYLMDEPDTLNTAPAGLAAISKTVRAWDPGTLQTFVVGQGNGVKRYSDVGDVLMLDWYPVPHLPLDSVADQIDTAFKYWPRNKPLWMVVQAFDWRDSTQRDPKKPRIGRFPNHEEMRFMSYLAVMHGARGIFFYRLQKGEAGTETLLAYPELWQAVRRVAIELKAMKPVFEEGRSIPLPIPREPDEPEAAAWAFRGRSYVVLANRSGTKAERVMPELLDRRWRALFEPRRDVRELLEKRRDGFYLPPYSVMVFESVLS